VGDRILSFDLTSYLHRVGFEGGARNDLATLQQLVFRHALAIPFENLDAWLGLPVTLDPESVFDKLVRRGRGGWCFEQNLLLGNALREIGFDVSDFGGRVVWGRAADSVAARTHRLLQVHSEGRRWLADVGFGALTPTGVLDLDSDAAQSTPHELFRLRRLGAVGSHIAENLLEAQFQGQWLPMYRFDPVPQQAIDFEAANYHLSTDPQSRFVRWLVVTKPTRDARPVLRDRDLVIHGRASSSEPRRLSDAAQLREVLEGTFGLDLTGLDGLEARHARAERDARASI
jgi:N-hydroxyarylamine O-acetyltransferase